MDLEFELKNSNYCIANTLRRTILAEIKIYSFSQVTITVNHTILHNDMMENRIGLIRIPKLPRELKAEDVLRLDLNVSNKEEKIRDVTIHDCKFYLNANSVELKFDEPLLLARLKKDNELILTATATKNIARINDRFSAVSICSYDELDEKTYKFELESHGQLTGKEIFNQACQIIIKKLDKIKEIISKELKDSEIKYEKVFTKYSHTMGNLLSYHVARDPEIAKSCYKVPHPNIEEMYFLAVSKQKPVKVIILRNIVKIQEIFDKLRR